MSGAECTWAAHRCQLELIPIWVGGIRLHKEEANLKWVQTLVSLLWGGRSLKTHKLLLKPDDQSWCSVKLGMRQGPKIYVKTHNPDDLLKAFQILMLIFVMWECCSTELDKIASLGCYRKIGCCFVKKNKTVFTTDRLKMSESNCLQCKDRLHYESEETEYWKESANAVQEMVLPGQPWCVIYSISLLSLLSPPAFQLPRESSLFLPSVHVTQLFTDKQTWSCLAHHWKISPCPTHSWKELFVKYISLIIKTFFQIILVLFYVSVVIRRMKRLPWAYTPPKCHAATEHYRITESQHG